jgi:putative heme-binding domain-containing protein
VIDLVAQALSWPSDKLSDARRIFVLEALSGCSLSDIPASWVAVLQHNLEHADAAVRSQVVRTLAVLEVPPLDDQLARIAENVQEPADVRIEALRAIIRRRPALTDEQFALLLNEIDATKTPLTRLVAGQVLSEARLETTQFGRLVDVIRHDPLISPTVALASFERSPVPEAAPELFSYLIESVQQSWILPERQVQIVIAALPVAQQSEAIRQLAAARQSTGDQAALLDEYQPLAEGGNTDRGRTLYFGKATCSTCHRVGNEGGAIGPDLTKVGAIRTARDLVESLVVPSATIAQRYETYTVITDAGRMFTGVLARQTPDLVVLHDASGAELRIRTDTIDEMEMSKRSLMPETTVKTLVREEVRDLLAFLKSLK